MSNKPLIAAALTMLTIYLLISFAAWELNAKHWEIGARVMYSIFSPIFAALIYSSVKMHEEQNHK